MKKYFCVISCLLAAIFAYSQPTFTQHIKPILEQKCVHCHNQVGNAPFPFKDYEDVKERSKTIRYVTEKKLMPIWKANPRYSHFEGENYLTEAEIKLIGEWCDAASPKGKGKSQINLSPTNRRFTKPDFVLSNTQPIILKPIGEDIFGLVKIPFEFPEPFDVGAIVFKNEQNAFMHHVSIFVLEEPAQHPIEMKKGKDNFFLPPIDKDTLAGKVFNLYNYLNILPPNQYEYWDLVRYKTHWQPGRTASFLPPKTGFKMPKKGVILLDMIHYLPIPKDLIENIRIEIYKAPEKVERQLLSSSIGIGNEFSTGSPIVLMPNQQRWIESITELPADMSLYEITPHMHLIGREFIAFAISPQNDTIPLIHIPEWDMGWQETYRYKQLLKLPKGTKIVIQGYYDNTTSNPKNPNNPPKIVQQSMNKQDEMLLLMLNFFEYQEGDEKLKLH